MEESYQPTSSQRKQSSGFPKKEYENTQQKGQRASLHDASTTTTRVRIDHLGPPSPNRHQEALEYPKKSSQICPRELQTDQQRHSHATTAKLAIP